MISFDKSLKAWKRGGVRRFQFLITITKEIVILNLFQDRFGIG